MNQYADVYAPPRAMPVAELEASRRGAFLTRTYLHLLGAIFAFVGLEVLLFTSGVAYPMAETMLSVSWLFVLGGFIVASWIASSVAHRVESPVLQYAALGGFIVAEAIIFVPLLAIANVSAPGAISSAALVTLVAFSGLTWIAMSTGKDFSFLGGMLRWGMILALVAIVGGAIFGFQLGTWFSVAMVGLAGGAILWDTSKIMHHYPEDRYVAASLELFASVALMFWYVLQLFLSRD